MSEMRYFYVQAAMDKYFVVDKEEEIILAICETESNAQKIAGSLNFNDKPGDYGFRVETMEEHDRKT